MDYVMRVIRVLEIDNAIIGHARSRAFCHNSQKMVRICQLQ